VDELWTVRAGLVSYEEARRAQKRLEAARHAGEVPDVLLLLEHPPVYTKGRRSTPDELPMGEDWYRLQGIEVRETDRGGRVTYHGPGQLVGYPIISLRPYADDVHEYIRRLERTIIEALADWGVAAGTIEGLTGVWTRPPLSGNGASTGGPSRSGDRSKIASIGVHVNRGVTTHGFAINVNNDLQPFSWIVPCGIDSCRVSSLSRETGAEQDLEAFAATVRDRFGEVYGRVPTEIGAEELVARVPSTEPLAAAPALP